PGSGKTRVLVHKLASLLLLEDVKHEQLLMLTFSRAAAIEFKQRLRELIGNAANFIEIKTFHSYCFDLLGKIGNINESKNVVKDAVQLLCGDDIDAGRTTKSVLVIDEAQDMDFYEYQLVYVLMSRNEDMRVIAVGDDDQNIYQFRGSDSKYLRSFITEHDAKQYSLIDNYRSCRSIVSFANQFVKTISERMKTEDIAAVKESEGQVKLIKHSGADMETALVEDVLSVNAKGTTCILTNTNREALLVLGVLKQKNIPAKLIQSIDGFDMYDIAEIRYFLKMLNIENSSPVISNEQWNNAVEALQNRYQGSSCMPVIMNILTTFEETNEKKYRTDLEMFLHESKIEDFYTNDKGVITISTMHKSKGREFDNVYMLLSNVSMDTDEEKRKLYVAMTRAKELLHIHYFGDAFDRFAEYATTDEVDLRTYPKPSELILQLSHRDVYLGFFKDKKDIIIRLKSGMHLAVRGCRLYIKAGDKLQPVLQFSKKCNEDIKKLIESGYQPYDAVIRFICAWKDKEDTEGTEETAIILADVYFHTDKKNGFRCLQK
ncbi:MAG: ATP-dependent helicase, partial [Ruminococcus sp.]|nr:ATP-dependent helicase [Ruminococcus sp.]